MASCVRNNHTKNNQNLTIGFQVTVKNIGDVSFETQCTLGQYEDFKLNTCKAHVAAVHHMS